MATQAGLFTIPTRIFLSSAHRQKLESLVREQEVDLPELLSELLVSHLDKLPNMEESAVPVSPVDDVDIDSEIHQRRTELGRLRARLAVEDGPSLSWARRYIADLEREIQHLEERR